MNSLSLFLYFADVIPSVGVLLGFVGVFITAACALICILYGMDDQTIPIKSITIALSCAFILFLITALTPSKNTLYAIAASELGQKAVESELGGKALKAIEHWINDQVKK